MGLWNQVVPVHLTLFTHLYIRTTQNRGWTAIINDDLVGRALTIGSFMVGCVCALAGAMWAHAVVDDHGWVFGGAFLSFLVSAQHNTTQLRRHLT